MAYSVIIPSAKAANVAACVAAIRKNGFAGEIIVVSDNIKQDERFAIPAVKWVEGVRPFIFARNCNLGIKEAGENDVILCNDDALLQTPGGFDALAVAAKTYGVVSPSIRGRCCNPLQKETMKQTITEPNFLAFVCVYITRETIKRVGLLDERFVPGNWEDNDYCRRATLAGVPLGVCGGCTVDHYADSTTFSGNGDYRRIVDENRRRFEEKWSLNTTLLSICVCSIVSRSHFLARLQAILGPQLTDRTEYLLAVDSGQDSIGKKRQRLLEAARGEFIVFIDDDDIVSADYVSQVLSAIYRNPSVDAITYYSKRYCDGIFEADCKYSITNANNSTHDYPNGIKTYSRFPYHVTPTRRELALKVGFPDKDFQEDTDFANLLRPLLKSEEFIPLPLYTYLYRSPENRKGEKTHRQLAAKR